MAYEKTNWNTGDIITAEKLNKVEQGIADASSSGGGGGSSGSDVFEIPITLTYDDAETAYVTGASTTITYNELLSAYQENKLVYFTTAPTDGGRKYKAFCKINDYNTLENNVVSYIGYIFKIDYDAHKMRIVEINIGGVESEPVSFIITEYEHTLTFLHEYVTPES